MKRKNICAEAALREVARKNHTTVEEVRKEIRLAMIAAMCNPDPAIQKRWNAIPHAGDTLTPEISSPQEAAIDELNFTMDAHSAELLLPHVNLFTYGNEIIKDDNAALTSYGLLHREDYQPMQTPVQETQEQAMTME